MSGTPVDILVDIDDRYSRPYLKSEYLSEDDDDPFELCSFKRKMAERDIGLELGLALEKSLKLHAQSNQQTCPQDDAVDTSKQMDLGILVNLDDSPEKNVSHQIVTKQYSSKESDVGFTNPASAFNLAWDVIEQEALNLADHIQYDKDKQTMSPSKIVDILWQSPDSPLLSPSRHANIGKEAPFLINSSPELGQKNNPKPLKGSVSRGRSSIPSSPAVAKSFATPVKRRPSISSSPMKKLSKPATVSPSKTAQKPCFKTPLVRTGPVVPTSAPVSKSGSKSGPMKANHGVLHSSGGRPRKSTSQSPVLRSTLSTTPLQGSAGRMASSVEKSISRSQMVREDSDLTRELLGKMPSLKRDSRRSSVTTPSKTPALQRPNCGASPLPVSAGPFRRPLARSDSDTAQHVQADRPDLPRHGSLRSATKRVAFHSSQPVVAAVAATTAASVHAKKMTDFARLKPLVRSKENQEPYFM